MVLIQFTVAEGSLWPLPGLGQLGGAVIWPTGMVMTEQIRYLLTLWDRISKRPGEIPVPESHLDLAKERLAAYRRDPHRARPAHDVLDRLANPDR
ncbi:MAG: hypothetical protein DMF83_31125 [Acidobacteria bacterium]|nr:MAG: hypothetical protein DMF83_31125 [Acidobacteriota bacterium]